MATSIALNDGTVTLRDFSDEDTQRFLTRNKENLVDKIAPDFPGLRDPADHKPSQVIKSNGLEARIHFAAQKTPRFTAPPGATSRPGSTFNRLLDHKSKVVDAVTKALSIFSGSNELKLPNHTIDVFVAEENGSSLGYLWWDGAENHAAIVLGKTAGIWGGGPNTKTVAQEVYEHYKPTLTVNGLTKRILAITVHEMGHVFHQMNSLEHYILMARCHELAIQPAGRPMSTDLQNTTVDDVNQVIQWTKEMSKGVSFYAFYEGLNEFVAEAFCAKVMGSPYGAGSPVATFLGSAVTKATIDEAYRACGGPEPEPTICYVRHLRS